MGQFDSLGAEIGAALNGAGVTANVTHLSKTQGAYNPATSSGTVTSASTTVKAAIGRITKELKPGVGVESGDVKLTVLDGEFTHDPAEGDGFTVRSKTYRCVAIAESTIGGALVCTSLQLRRA